LGERGEGVQSFKTDVDLQYPRLGAFNPSSHEILWVGFENRLRARWGREGGDGEEGVRSNSERGKWILLTMVKGYLYPKNPDTPG
jgi:hypothetical protein